MRIRHLERCCRYVNRSEVIVAAHSGLKVLGISWLNFAAGFQEELNHEEVVATERVSIIPGLLKAIC